MKYIALIRGINVGGKNIIPMKQLQSAIADAGFANVTTYIQSGNVIFESKESSCKIIAKKLESVILQIFGCETRVVVMPAKQIGQIVREAPENWHKRQDIRKYVAFVIPDVTIPEVMVEIVPRAGVDELHTGEGVLYMTILLSAITKSNISKLSTKKFYKLLTIRNFNTVCKLSELAIGWW